MCAQGSYLVSRKLIRSRNNLSPQVNHYFWLIGVIGRDKDLAVH
jgi:hypothetical protein